MIVGVQVHHSATLGLASAFAANALTALESARRRSTDVELDALISEMALLVRQIGVASEAARLRLQLHQADPEFRSYVDGDLPWPDENPDVFQPRCRCHDRCLFHDIGRGTEADCNCDERCRAHP